MQPFTFFVSYRRQDTAPIALLLKYEIEKRLQLVRVLVDIEEIRHGDTFPHRIEQLIGQAHATIVLIGANWMPPRVSPGSKKPRSSAAKEGPSVAKEDWIVKELMHSMTSAINFEEEHRYGLNKRVLLPIFVNCPRSFEQFDLPKALDDIFYTHAEHIEYANWTVAIGPLIERIAVNLNLKKRSDADEYPKPDAAKGRTQQLRDQDIAAILTYEDYEGWYLDNIGNAEARYLVKTFKFPHFNQAADFMQLVSNYCRVLDHHPEWRNVFNHVNVSLTTWDARRRVTIYDLHLALFMNKAAQTVLKRGAG